MSLPEPIRSAIKSIPAVGGLVDAALDVLVDLYDEQELKAKLDEATKKRASRQAAYDALAAKFPGQ